MKHPGFWRKNRDFFMLSGLLIVFVGGIFGIGSLFSIGSFKPRTVILPSEQFNSRLAPPQSNIIQIESATKLTTDFAIYDFDMVDRNTMILNRPERSYSGLRLSLLHLDDNQVKDIAGNTDYGISLSPNLDKLIYSQYRSGLNQKTTYEYDIQSEQRSKLPNDNSYYRTFMGNDTYVGQDDLALNLVDMKSGHKRDIYSYDELKALITEMRHIKNQDKTFFILDYFEASQQRKQVYILVMLNDKYAIYTVPLAPEADVKLYAEMKEIQQYKLLKNGDMLIQGNLNNVVGLYRYRAEQKQFDLLVKGSIWNFDLDADESRIAYFRSLEGQKYEVHTAFLNGSKLSSDTVIYRNIDNFVKLKWNKDELFVVGSSVDKSELYRFSFKAW
ncbi:hypothetical protein [Paenibacillus pabuli]|uniref:hypothetical protein n=1 Tax=Paenibacillus pabuli TaxID=1472 RepID=UPI003CEF793A